MSVRWTTEIAKVLWDMRWQFFWGVALLVGLHFAFEFADVLFPHRRAWDTVDTALLLVFGGMVLWGYSADLRKRVETLEETVEELKRERGR